MPNWYKVSQTQPQVQPQITPQQYAQGLLNNQYNPGQSDNEPAMWDAIDGDIPYFNMIQSRQRGFGYPAFLHFLTTVGTGKQFASSDFTPDGAKLFHKAVSQGMIQQQQSKGGQNLTRSTLWQVTGNPQQALQQFGEQVRS